MFQFWTHDFDCKDRFNRDFVPQMRYPHQGNNNYNQKFNQTYNRRNMSAYMATPETVIDEGWYLDSGATHHLTNDINNLSISEPYEGNEKLIIGNGTRIQVCLATNPVYHARTKHIELDVHFIREKVLNKQVEIRYVPSEWNIVDVLTKPLAYNFFNCYRDKLNVVPRPLSLRRGFEIANNIQRISG